MQSDLKKNAKDAFYEAAEAASPGAKKTELRAFWHSVVGMLLKQVCSYGMVGCLDGMEEMQKRPLGILWSLRNATSPRLVP